MIASKYENLLTAQKAGVSVPEMCYITTEDIESQRYKKKATDFATAQATDFFIVRSAVTNEDGETISRAGFFISSGRVSKQELLPTVLQVHAENSSKAETLDAGVSVHVIIMPFIVGSYGGVLFSPWLYFNKHACIEFSDSPQKVVAGTDVTYGLVSLHKQYEHSPECAVLPKQLLCDLQTTVNKLQTLFPFRLDVEWVYDGDTLFILQIRPVTIAPTAMTARPVTDDKFCYTALSETFGKLSPLSFALLQYLYKHATAYWQAVNITGGTDFLHRAPTGNVLVNQQEYLLYYKDRSFFSSFLRGFQAVAVLKKLERAADDFTIPETYSLPDIQTAFDSWQTATFMEQVARIKTTTYAMPFEYELTAPIKIEDYSSVTVAATWKKIFFKTLTPLRRQLAVESNLLWCTDVCDLSQESIDPTQYKNELLESLVTYIPEKKGQKTTRVCGGSVAGLAYVINEPARWNQTLPTDKIIVVPYIPQSWIAQLPRLQGIATVSLTALSHAAIVLREYNIPTAHVTEDFYVDITDGKEISF